MEEQILRYFAGELSRQERLTLLRKVTNNPELTKIFEYYRNTMALCDICDAPADNDAAEESCRHVLGRQKRLRWLRNIRNAAAGVAAAVAIVICTLMWSGVPIGRDEVVAENVIKTPAGQRAQVILPDGTEIWLNAKSTLRYPSKFTGSLREVSLDGEAYFTVTKNSGQPFQVLAGDVRVRVTGTEFNVNSYAGNGNVVTSLVKGHVKVFKADSNTGSVDLLPGEEAILHNGKISVTHIAKADHFMWREGIYAFDNEPILEIFRQLELYYDVKISVKDSTLFCETYTGKFRQCDGIEEILNLLRQINGFDVYYDRENNYIRLSR